MEIKTHEFKELKIAELISKDKLINTAEDGLDLLGTLYFQGFDKIILHQKDLTEDFFDLKNGMAGEILQKFSNYRVRLAIIGDFGMYQSQSIKDFIYESNQFKQVNFLSSTAEAIERFLKS